MGRIKQLFRYPRIQVKGSSLIETLIATIIIMIVFGIAMMSITNILENTVKNSTSVIDTELNKLSYQYRHNLIKVPDVMELGLWKIEVKKAKEGELDYVVFEATHRASRKVRSKKLVAK
ncbi:MAG: hypothetical protein JKY02_00380 [Flavobacteriaceae bacterium]|nr:hypothetical protein [Flavobacteriaceae bacterium]